MTLCDRAPSFRKHRSPGTIVPPSVRGALRSWSSVISSSSSTTTTTSISSHRPLAATGPSRCCCLTTCRLSTSASCWAPRLRLLPAAAETAVRITTITIVVPLAPALWIRGSPDLPRTKVRLQQQALSEACATARLQTAGGSNRLRLALRQPRLGRRHVCV